MVVLLYTGKASGITDNRSKRAEEEFYRKALNSADNKVGVKTVVKQFYGKTLMIAISLLCY